jgi:hypothetical protein
MTKKQPTTKQPTALPKTKPIKKATKITKATKESKEVKDTRPTLDLCLILDCTSSMQVWIERSKDSLHEIIKKCQSDYEGLRVRVSFVGYRDILDKDRFSVQPFSEDITEVSKFIASQIADGGRDWPEDV